MLLPSPDARAERWPDGRYHLKIGWWRGIDGELELSASSLRTDDTVTHDVSGGYGTKGFQPTTPGFTTTGCWLLTGTLGETKVSIIIDVRQREEP
ncbi:hypothetical protein [Actinomadura alba]|uniref:Uncharacterized protein n=1 Tax=Actinomadura alba TaxID=406431 RepID=A0ABR7LSE4_9ACTN|nr:hypothetical protein [Actinomadura alba]MBC6467747.1 hypothetical protein [Actinomadura alba]